MANRFKTTIYARSFPVALLAIASAFLFLISSCKHNAIIKPVNSSALRTYRMGFQNYAPSYNTIEQTLDMWTQRADAAIISLQVPWDSLYSGTTPETYITENYGEVVNYYRSKSFKLWVYIDPVNGLNRSADADDLAALGKSISQTPVQNVYGRFAFVMDSLLKPDHLGPALETNLVRASASTQIYQGVKTAANTTATLIRAFDKHVQLSISVQAEQAWGVLNAGPYQGIDQDFADFPFIQELGISSYPFFAYNTAQDIPPNYYSRLVEGHSLPVFISEGGWSSLTVGNYTETPQKQQDYIITQGQLLSQVNAIAYFQLTFTDFATSPGTTISLFSHLGLLDSALNAKPALASWDQLFSHPLVARH